MTENTKFVSVISYITWIGWIVALIKRSPRDSIALRHINQALVLNLMSSVAGILFRIGSIFAVAGDVISLCVFVLFIMGLIRAFKCSGEPLPLIGGINIIS